MVGNQFRGAPRAESSFNVPRKPGSGVRELALALLRGACSTVLLRKSWPSHSSSEQAPVARARASSRTPERSLLAKLKSRGDKRPRENLGASRSQVTSKIRDLESVFVNQVKVYWFFRLIQVVGQSVDRSRSRAGGTVPVARDRVPENGFFQGCRACSSTNRPVPATVRYGRLFVRSRAFVGRGRFHSHAFQPPLTTASPISDLWRRTPKPGRGSSDSTERTHIFSW